MRIRDISNRVDVFLYVTIERLNEYGINGIDYVDDDLYFCLLFVVI
jgi:hypothetical protein